MSGDGFQIKFLVTWSLLVSATLVLVHEALQFPVFALTYVFMGIAFLSLFFFFIRPVYSLGYALLFLIPFSCACLGFWYLSDWPQGLYALLFFCVLGGLFSRFLYRADILTQQNLKEIFDHLQRGKTSRQAEIFYQDERGEVLREVNRFSRVLREREVLRQVISRERWEEIQANSPENPLRSREKSVLALILTFEGEGGKGEIFQEVLSEILPLCDEYSGFLNQYHSANAEILFFQDSNDYERNSLLMMRDLYLWALSKSGEIHLQVVLIPAQVKTGMIALPGGYRHLCLSPETEFEVNRLRNLDKDEKSAGFYVNQQLSDRASLVFHLDTQGAGQEAMVQISRVKALEEHIQKLSSSRVEEKLLSLRVIQSQDSLGPDAVLPLLGDVSPRVRIEAVRAAIQLCSAQDRERVGLALIDCLAAEWNHDCRATLAIALGDLGKKEYIKLLFPMLKDENPRVRANAVEAIGKSLNRRLVLGYLEESLEDTNNRSKANAALAVWLMGERKGLQVLKGMALSDDPLHSCSGLYGIGEIFTPRNVQIISSSQKDPIRFYEQNQKNFTEVRQICEKLIFHEHPLVERNALNALKKIRSRFSEPILVKKLNQATDPSTREMVLGVLEVLVDPADWLLLKRRVEI